MTSDSSSDFLLAVAHFNLPFTAISKSSSDSIMCDGLLYHYRNAQYKTYGENCYIGLVLAILTHELLLASLCLQGVAIHLSHSESY